MTKNNQERQWMRLRNKMREEFRSAYRMFTKHNNVPCTFFQSVDNLITNYRYCLCLQPNEVDIDRNDYLAELESYAYLSFGTLDFEYE